MSGSIAFSFLAGLLSILSPCVLPLLPILLSGALQQHRLAPVALTLGLVTSFTLLGLVVATLGFASGIESATIRGVAAGVRLSLGLVMLSTTLQMHFTQMGASVSTRFNSFASRISGNGLAGQFLLGTILGAAWSPCAGPTLGAAIGMAAQSGTMLEASGIMASFSVGAAIPMLVIAYGSRQAMTSRRNQMARLASWAKPVMGGALLTMGLLIVTGFDKSVETQLTNTMPSWLVDLTTSF